MVILWGKFKKNLKKKAIRMFFRTVLWLACVQYFDTGRAWPPPKKKIKAKISSKPSTIRSPSRKPLIYKDFYFYITEKTIW